MMEQTFDVGLNGVGFPDGEAVEIVSGFEAFLLRAKDDNDRKSENTGVLIRDNNSIRCLSGDG